MSVTLHPVVGTIQVTPVPFHRDGGSCDDSTLERLLASLAHRECLDDAAPYDRGGMRLVASRRLNWARAAGGGAAVRANLAQLIEELQDELDQLGGAAV
jgi:hypothetical protein